MRNSYRVKVLPIQMANSLTDIGTFTFGKLFRTFGIFLRQIYILATTKVDLYYIALSPINFAFYKDFILVLIAKIFQKKIVIHLHGQGIHRAASQSHFKRRMYGFVFRNTQVICLAKPLFEDIKLVYTGRPYFLANGIKREPDISYNGKTTTFLFLSNLMKEKGIEVFLNALVRLKQKGYIFSAEVIGDSADYSIEEAKEFVKAHHLSDQVKVLGPMYGSDKYKHLTKAKILVLPSFQECFPLTILEAYQAKTAVISTHTGGIPEIISNGENGFVIEPRNLDSLIEKMEVFLNNPSLHLEMGKSNFAKFEKHYTQAAFIKKLIEIFQTNVK